MPSMARPEKRWKARTLLAVNSPKMPVCGGMGTSLIYEPMTCSIYCSTRTGSPVLPSRSKREYCQFTA